MSDEKSWIVIGKPENDNGTESIKVLTDEEGQIFDMASPEQIEEMIILHNSQMANAVMGREAALVQVANLQTAVDELENELEDADTSTGWADVFYQFARGMGLCAGIALIVIAVHASDIIHAIRDNPTTLVAQKVVTK